ncbi:DUF3052 domain-containing protein [Psychroserpens luteolus]|uniref:DUF3052 domain-containing protein n=1 Tax=Psychroserpens luteolus TaxID=2855840 RepID=UPI001E6582AB|nr:DUF3052 domain-containing protein [Psychroserpens luteolus]MCD2258703.1 DUF3052 domain-containing protein [Psychroserpens luteolus]
MNSGYSKTPLAKKLGIKSGYSFLLYNAPNHYFNLFEDLPDDINELTEASEKSADFIHVFCTTLEDLNKVIDHYKPALKTNGLFWVSWPKGSSKIKTDLKREPIRDLILNKGLVDIKVAAIDNDWSGLKFVYRLKDRT